MSVLELRETIIDTLKVVSIIRIRDIFKLLLPILHISTTFYSRFLHEPVEVRTKGDFRKFIAIYNMLKSHDYRIFIDDNELRVYIPRYKILSRSLNLNKITKLYYSGVLCVVMDLLKRGVKCYYDQHGSSVLELSLNNGRRVLFTISDLFSVQTREIYDKVINEFFKKELSIRDCSGTVP